ncbi:MAG TPA: 3'-5' exonuclease [Planctomycetaceae bacterium]|nr:3'-5' exonuclease [Planctomycetaceae bacterium]HRF01705.1 3'-5' exonuclease [Pirellulaceae bacterium]
MYLFLDTETSGLPKRWNAPLTDLRNWPRIVQLAWILCDERGDEQERDCRLIAPDGWTIDPGATRRHRITTAHAKKHGEPIAAAIAKFSAAAARGGTVVAHNIEFDLPIVGAEFLRLGQVDPLTTLRRRCTMRETTKVCRLPGRYGFKWPTLDELHRHLFGVGFEDAHDALADCDACRRCFLKLEGLTPGGE